MKIRGAAAIAVAAALVAGLSGCEFISPQWTQHSYAPSDGLNTTFGSIEIRDVFLVTLDGTRASLIAGMVNSANTPVTVQMQYTTATGTTTQKIQVPPNALLDLRPGGQLSVTLEGIKAPAGSLFQVYFSSAGKGSQLRVPVLNNTQSGYQTLTPAPPSPIPTGVQTVAPSPGAASATPTESPSLVP